MEAGELIPVGGHESLDSSKGLSPGDLQDANPQGGEDSLFGVEERQSLTSEWFLPVP